MTTQVLDWGAPPPEGCRGGAVAIGNFDGAHRGHAVLVAELARRAVAVAGPAIVLTFDPHPLTVLRPDVAPVPLTTPEDRSELLHRLGADHVVVLRTTPDLLALSATDFFTRIVRDGLAARAVVEGPNFGFGRNREGDINTLGELCRQAGVELHVVTPAGLDGGPVSSSRVRAALLAGEMAQAVALLGRPYALRGVVGTGARRGRAIGFPTANLEQTRTLVPGDGVYAAWADVPGGRHPAAVNVGPNPTFGEHGRKIEAHLVGYTGDLYGRELTLHFLERVRGLRRFDGAEALREQLSQDVARAREIAEGQT